MGSAMYTSVEPVVENRDNDRYDLFLATIQSHFEKMTPPGTPLFTTDASGLFDVFLNNLPNEARQHYTCHACRQFFDRYGGLTVIAADGEQILALGCYWTDDTDVEEVENDGDLPCGENTQIKEVGSEQA